MKEQTLEQFLKEHPEYKKVISLFEEVYPYKKIIITDDEDRTIKNFQEKGYKFIDSNAFGNGTDTFYLEIFSKE